MRKIIFFFIVFLSLGIVLVMSHFRFMEFANERDKYKKALNEIKKRNAILEEERDVLKRADYETVRRKALESGFIKKNERVIRFYDGAR
ncbi:TPA: hypothetical protein DCX16_06800 [bacterium]|nr:hypothetical protein [bacterium]